MNEAKMKTRRRYAPSSSSRSLPSAPSQALRWPEWPCPMASTPMSCTSGAAGVSTCAGHPHRAASRRHQRVSDLAPGGGRAVRPVDARAAQVIRVDSLWLATEPMDMRAGVGADQWDGRSHLKRHRRAKVGALINHLNRKGRPP
jgi:hypothetical protein